MESMVGFFAELFLEVEAGRRSHRQLAPFLTPMLYARLADVWVRGGQPGHVLRVSVVAHDPAQCDVVVTVRRGNRCGAISLRLTRRTGRPWKVADLARPEDGPLPLPSYPVAPDDAEADDDWVLPPLPLAAPHPWQPAGEAATPTAGWFLSPSGG